MLRDVPRQPGDLAAQLGECTPARRCELGLRVGEQEQLLCDALRVPAVRDSCEPFELGEREAERLADVANGAA